MYIGGLQKVRDFHIRFSKIDHVVVRPLLLENEDSWDLLETQLILTSPCEQDNVTRFQIIC